MRDVLTDANGALIKEMSYDSFGNQLDDSLPELFIPVGFAGGLVDRDTGLVRFGFRDYDPAVGRFTAPDPLGDTGGDHDLYEYCVDDPVSFLDSTGLKEEHVGEDTGILGKMFWIFLPNSHPYKKMMQEYGKLVMERETRGLAGGLQDLLRWNSEAPPGRWIFPGPTEEQWKDAQSRWKKGEEDLQKREGDFMRKYGKK